MLSGTTGKHHRIMRRYNNVDVSTKKSSSSSISQKKFGLCILFLSGCVVAMVHIGSKQYPRFLGGSSSFTSAVIKKINKSGSKITSIEDIEGLEMPVSPQLLDDIEYDILGCGKWKCFAKSKSNSKIGYLLIRNSNNWDDNPSARTVTTPTFYMKLHYFAECMKRKYEPNLNHNVGQPHWTTMTRSFLSQMVVPERTGNNFATAVDKYVYYDVGPILVMPVLTFNYDTTVLFRPPDIEPIRNHILKYLNSRDGFYERFTTSMQTLTRVITDKRCLADDFQVYINEEGNVYLFDIDKCALNTDNNPRNKHIYTTNITHNDHCLDSDDKDRSHHVIPLTGTNITFDFTQENYRRIVDNINQLIVFAHDLYQKEKTIKYKQQQQQEAFLYTNDNTTNLPVLSDDIRGE
mmetsp:Transcript_25891/g.29614  ORF Transcript_25891/g.29614 Transcript_25891/m.29614 type:complete len:405 (-) Transcript_25891:15-1229(-)